MDKTQQLNHELTIVIPTLGGSSLISTLYSINCGSMIPIEVIISLPPKINIDQIDIGSFKFKVNTINAKKKGQVRQRFEGIKAAVSEYILQMDDDIELKHDCIEKLYDGCKSMPQNVAISPKILEKKTSLSFYEYNNLHFNEYSKLCNPKNISRKIFNFIIHGKKKFLPGEVTKLGMNIQAYSDSTRYIEVDWLHGMLIQHKENFLDFEHLHFTGKAFAEDCIFSSYLKLKNINLYVDNDAMIIAEIDHAKAVQTIEEIRFFLAQKYFEIRNKAYYCYLSKRRYKTFIFYSVVKFIIFIILRTISKFKKVFRKI